MEIYLQFWFPSSSIGPQGNGIVLSPRASTTATPVAYALASSSAGVEQLRGSRFYGTYESRIDRSITSPPLPGIRNKVVVFKKPFPNFPKVAVSLTVLCARTGPVVAVQATATNITTTQFTLHIDSSAGDHLRSVGAAWAAWSGDEKLAIGSRNGGVFG